VAKELLNILGVHVPAEKQRRAGVAQIVEVGRLR
jgi:hypothetical protein